MLESWEDWLDEDDHICSPLPGHNDILRTGEHGLGILLRFGLSNKSVKFVGHADFQPVSGLPTEVTLFNPDADVSRDKALRRVGFRIKLKATTGVKPKYVDMEWEAQQLTDGPDPGEKGGKPGEFPRVVEKIAAGSSTMPIGMALIMQHPKGGRRVYILILRIASLEEP